MITVREVVNAGLVTTAQQQAQVRQEIQYRHLAGAIASQAQAIADGNITGPRYASVQRLKSNVATLEAWTADDREN